MNKEKEFFKFIYKRQLIWYKRFVLKENPPWTTDEILKKYKIINVYRELDKCTLYIIDKLKKIKDREQTLANIVFYRFFNLSGLYENLEIPVFTRLDEQVKYKILESLNKIKNSGKPIFNNAYLISSGEMGVKKHVSILNNLKNTNFSDLVEKIDSSITPQESLKEIQSIPMIGPFLACEIWTDLAYLKFFKQKWTDNDFVNIGPGAEWGLEILYGPLTKKQQEAKLKNLHETQREILPKIHDELNEEKSWQDIAFKQASSNYPFLSLTNIEGSLCEFRKYWNISNGKGRRKYFIPQSNAN